MTAESLSVQGQKGVNDDRCLLVDDVKKELFAIVADGLGGHLGGAQAAENAVMQFQMAVKSWQQAAPTMDRFDFDAYASLANEAIWQLQQSDPGASGDARTTVVALHLDVVAGVARWAHCGDSRLYHFRRQQVQHFTRDHTVAQMLVYDGELQREDIRTHPDRNKLTRCFGGSSDEARMRVSQEPVDIESGDRFLLCTDGWWEYLTEEEMIRASFAGSADSADEAVISVAADWMTAMDQIIQSRIKPGADDRTACAVSIA